MRHRAARSSQTRRPQPRCPSAIFSTIRSDNGQIALPMSSNLSQFHRPPSEPPPAAFGFLGQRNLTALDWIAVEVLPTTAPTRARSTPERPAAAELRPALRGAA